MSQPVDPNDELLRYYKAKSRSLRPSLTQLTGTPAAPLPTVDVAKSANTAKEDPRAEALSAGMRKAFGLTPPGAAPAAAPSVPPPAVPPKSPPASPPSVKAPSSLTAAEQAELPSLPDLPMETPAAPRGLLGRMWDGLWRTVSLTGEEVFGDDTLDKPETPEEAAKRGAAGKAELRRKLGALPADVRKKFGDEAESIEDLSQRIMAYEMAQRSGERPEDAVSYVMARQGMGVDVTGTYAKLKDAAFRDLRQQHPGVLTPAALADLRARAETKAKADLAGYMVLPTGLPMVVRDVDGWKEQLQGLPLALRIPLAIVTTPTDLVYRGTVSHRSVSKWQGLDIFGRMALSTPLGAAIEMVPKEDVFPMLARSAYSAVTDLPLTAGIPAWLGALMPDVEGVTFQDLVDSPEMVDRLIEGSDLATAMGRIAAAVAHEAKGTPFESTIGEHPILTALALTIPVMIMEPDILTFALGPIGIANDALKASDAFSGVAKMDGWREGVAEALRKSESTDIGDLRGEMDALHAVSAETELLTADQFAHVLGVNPSLKLHYADHIKKRQKLIAEMSTLEAEAAKAASADAKASIDARIAGIRARIASDDLKMWEEIVKAGVEDVVVLKETIEATTVQKLKRKGATTTKPVKLRQKHIDEALAALPTAEKERDAAATAFKEAYDARSAAQAAEKARVKPRGKPAASPPTTEPGTEFATAPDYDVAYKELASAQRGVPENAMLEVQRVAGGGVLQSVVEHAGDLIHRMSEWGTSPRGDDSVRIKTETVLRRLNPDRTSMPFRQELEQNLLNNGHLGTEEVDEALAAYAAAHAQLPVYSVAQRLARDAAVAIGRKEFERASDLLTELHKLASDETKWAEAIRPAKAPQAPPVVRLHNSRSTGAAAAARGPTTSMPNVDLSPPSEPPPVRIGAGRKPKAPLKSTLKVEEAFKAAGDRLSRATAEQTRLERYKLYSEAKQQILPAFKHIMAARRATAKLAKAPIKPLLKEKGKVARAAEKVAGKIDKAEAFLEIGPRFAEARRKTYRRLLAGHDALRSIADVPTAPLAGTRRFENVKQGALAKLVLRPSKYGVSEVAFRDQRSAEQLLNAAVTYPEGAAAGRIADLDTAAFHRALDEKYGGMVVASYRQRLKDPDLVRIFAAPLDRKVGLSTDDVTKMRQAVDQLDAFALVELKVQADLLPALALLRQIESAPATFYGNALTKNIRAVFWWARRYLSPTGGRWGQVNEDLIRIEQVAEVTRDTYQSDMMEISIMLDPVKRQDALFAYIDTAIPIDVGRGDTLGNGTIGRSMWHEMGDYIAMKRALWESAKGGKLDGVVDDTAKGNFEQMMVADVGFLGLARMFIAHGPGVPAETAKTDFDLVHAALKAHQESDSFRDFTDRFGVAMYAKRLEVDERERALVHGALAVAHMASMKKAMLQASGAFAGAITVPEAQAMNAMLTRATGGTEYDLDLALRTLERMGLTFLRDSKARGMFGRHMREINESSKQLVAHAVDPTTGAVHFLPKLLLDDLSMKVDNMVKEIEPIAERKGDPVGGFISGLGSSWKRSVTVGFLIPKVRYTLAGVAIGDWSQVFAWNGPRAAGALAARTLTTHLPGYGRVLAYASRTLEQTGTPGAKWVGSKIDALTSPVLNGVFLGKQGTIRVGARVYTFDELRTMLRDDGILESVTREELLRDVDQLARHSEFGKWRKVWQHEIEAHAEMTQVRLRSMYYLQLLQRGADRKTARKETLDALYNWKHGFAEWESATLLKLNVPFYRFFKLAFRQALQVQMEPFMRATDPKMYAEAALGRTKLGRYRQTALAQSAIPDWMATEQAWNENKDEVDELMQLSLMLTGRSDWAQGGRLSYASKLDPRERVFAREAFNKMGAYEMSVFPEMTPLMSMSWWLNLHGTLATVMGWGAMGGAAGLGMAGPPMIGPRPDMVNHLWQENVAQFAGPVGDLIKDGAAWSGGRANVSPGEAMIGEQLERIPMMPQFFNVDKNREGGRGLQANTFPVLLLRMIPFILQLPDWGTAGHNTRFAQGQQQGITQALLHVLGLRRLYSRDPMADQEREIRRITSELQREVEVEQSRAGVPIDFGLFRRYEPLKK